MIISLKLIMMTFCLVIIEMSTSQEQDLVFYNDGTLVSEVILNSCDSYLSLILHLQGTSPQWLLYSLIENSLVGTAGTVNNDLNRKIPNRSEVFCISFLNSYEHFLKNCKKNGLDLATTSNFKFFNFFDDLFTRRITKTLDCSAEVEKLFEEVSNEMKKSATNRKILFVEGAEILLSATTLQSNDLLKHIFRLGQACRQTFIISRNDSPQVFDIASEYRSSPVYQCTDFLSRVCHQAQLIINLMPLATGRSEDVTGSITVCKGLLPIFDDCLRVQEERFLYRVTKESNVKLYYV